MNVRRGLFRLWVVASLAWVLVAGTVTWFIFSEQSRESSEVAVRIELPDGQIIKIPSGEPEELVWEFLNDEFPIVSDLSETERRQFRVGVNDALSKSETPTPFPWGMVLLTGGAPIVMYGIGSVGFWIAAGFRSSGPN